MTAPTCPKCGGEMIEGFVVDHTYGGKLQADWAEGKPQKSFWIGVSVAAEHPIATFRCKGCGYLESYAAMG